MKTKLIFLVIANVVFFTIGWHVAEIIKKYIKQQEIPIITCPKCKGERIEIGDYNKLMMEGILALQFNKHISADHCEKCIKVGDVWLYCEKMQSEINETCAKYEKSGPDIQEVQCSECLGMGTFTMLNSKTNKFYTQKEYEEREKD